MSESAAALEEKAKGNECYKKRDFVHAAIHYQKAIELDPKEITFLSNLAAVRFEEKNFEECVKVSESGAFL